MSLYTTDLVTADGQEMVYFGTSPEADLWIFSNIPSAVRESGVMVESTGITEVHPGVFRYVRAPKRTFLLK